MSKAGRLSKTVVLIGMMGAGKTAIGRGLAQRLEVPFLDSDQEIERAANATIAEVFARDGEEFFRDRESAVIARLMAGPAAVLSTGGGAWLAARNRQIIGQAGVALWLDAPLDLLWERVRHKDTRPLLRTPEPRATLARLLAARRPLYALAPLRVAADPAYSVAQMTQHVLEHLAQQGDIVEPLDEPL